MSWVIIEKKTNKAVLETYSDYIAVKFNEKKGYKSVPIMKYLQGLNDGKYSK